MGRRGARPHHPAPAARGDQRARNRRRYARPAVSTRRGRDLARLPRFATSRGVRMLLGNDFESDARSASGSITSRADSTTCRPPIRSSSRSSSSASPGMPYEHYRRRAAVAAGGRGHRAAAARSARGHAGGALLLARDGARHAAHREPARHAMASRRATRCCRAGWAREMARRFARERRDRHAGRAAQHRWRRSARARRTTTAARSGWFPQRELAILNIANPGGSAVRTCRRCCCGARVPAPRPSEGASIGSRRRTTARRMRPMDMKVASLTQSEGFVDSREFARMTRAIEFIEREYQRQPRLAEIARHVGLSEFHFNRLFRRWTGLTPKQYLAEVTSRAAGTALRSEPSVLDAAHSVGLSGGGRLHDLTVTLEAHDAGRDPRRRRRCRPFVTESRTHRSARRSLRETPRGLMSPVVHRRTGRTRRN